MSPLDLGQGRGTRITTFFVVYDFETGNRIGEYQFHKENLALDNDSIGISGNILALYSLLYGRIYILELQGNGSLKFIRRISLFNKLKDRRLYPNVKVTP